MCGACIFKTNMNSSPVAGTLSNPRRPSARGLEYISRARPTKLSYTLLTGYGVEKHQIFEVGYLAALPFLRHVRVSHQLSGRHHGRSSAKSHTSNDQVIEIRRASAIDSCTRETCKHAHGEVRSTTHGEERERRRCALYADATEEKMIVFYFQRTRDVRLILSSFVPLKKKNNNNNLISVP